MVVAKPGHHQPITALIAGGDLAHEEVVRTLITAKAPLDHVNNLGGRR